MPTLDPRRLMGIGRKLAPLRDEGVLIVGSGFFSHPRTEHFAPLFVTMGAAEGELGTQRKVIDGFWMGLAKRSVQFG